MTARYSIEEKWDLSEFRYPMEPIPARIEAAIGRGVICDRSLPFDQAWRVIEPDGDGMEDGVVRNPDGVMVVCCRTDMPGVTPEMWDWWFGWHSISSERYRLWHPQEHVACALAEDRSGDRDDRARYIGNTSFVAEHIGDTGLAKLAIAFKPPVEFGLSQQMIDRQGTAICARGGYAGRKLEMSSFVHFVRGTAAGSEMRSRFWLGLIESRVPILGGLLTRALDRPTFRRRAISDHFGLSLLRHCSQEMNHLARILRKHTPKTAAKFAQAARAT